MRELYGPAKEGVHSLGGTTTTTERLIIDLRKPADFEGWHLPGAVNYPLESLDSGTVSPFAEANLLEKQWSELENFFQDSKNIAEVRGRRVLLLCYNGDTARVATSVLQAKGVDAESVRGGYQAVMPN